MKRKGTSRRDFLGSTGAGPLAVAGAAAPLARAPAVAEGVPPMLISAALEAVRQWRSQPGEKGGRAVAVRAAVEVHFRLL